MNEDAPDIDLDEISVESDEDEVCDEVSEKVIEADSGL